jgi:putative oxidoreductase
LFFALLFIGSGIGHLRQTAAMAGYASSKGVPAAKAATIISGLMILLGAAYIALGFYADLGALLIFCIPSTNCIFNAPILERNRCNDKNERNDCVQ